MRMCCICKKKGQRENGTLFMVPKDDKRRKQWSESVRMEFTPNAYICASHFSPNHITTSGTQRLLPIAVPIVQPLPEAASGGCFFTMQELPNTVTKQQSQTDLKYFDIERKKYATRIRELGSKNKDLKCKLTEANTAIDSMRKLKSPGNIPVLRSYPLKLHDTPGYFERKLKNWSSNVIVVTPKDPEFVIYKNRTGIFSQEQLQTENDVTNTIQLPLLKPNHIKMPTIKSVSCSMSTQTNTRLCGSVQISEFLDEYRLNCFYCSATFPLEKYLKFIKHLKDRHFEREESFHMLKYPFGDHDYTTIRSKSPERINAFSTPPPLRPKLIESKDRPFNIGMAETLMKLLDETLLNPNFRLTEEDNILVIKSNSNNNLAKTNVLEQIINTNSNASPEVKKRTSIKKQNTLSVKPDLKENIALKQTSSPMKRKLKSDTESEFETITDLTERSLSPVISSTSSSRNIDSAILSEPYIKLPPIKKSIFKKPDPTVEKRAVQQTLKNIKDFETVYKTVKKLPARAMTSGVYFIKDIEKNIVTEKQTSTKTPLNRCLKRANTETTEQLLEVTKIPKLNPTELVFEFTPRDIILELLDCMKDNPILWEFHNEPDNDNYDKAINELCEKLNSKWSQNLSPLQMRRSINRILNNYRYMLPCKNITKFEEYFKKLAEFLPSSDKDIPRKRCEYCDICYAKDSEMKQHLIDKHQYTKWEYNCGHCWERFMEHSQCELHKHLPHYIEVFKCQQCNNSYTTIYTLERHEKHAHRRKVIIPIPPKIHKCNVCDKEFKNSSELACHKTCHKENRFNCHLCPKTYTKKTTLTFHLKKHNQELDFVCEVCGKAFLMSSHLNSHMEMHTGVKVTCNICHIKIRKKSLYRHLRLCHVACEGTIESTYRAQRYHYRKFLSDNKNSFRNRAKRPFIRTKEERPRIYNCKKCNIRFDRLKFLKEHNNVVHADVKIMQCKFCNTQFRSTNNIKMHYRRKHNLSMFQIFKLHDQNMDLDTVLNILIEDMPEDAGAPIKLISKKEPNVTNQNNSLQDEIMKAVENIDKQEIKVDNDQSMSAFFTDLLKRE